MLNHLWQSTLFALVAGVLVLAFRKNRAHVRYWIWLVASFKFLIPFSLIAAVGGYFASEYSPAIRGPLFLVIQQAAEPFPAPSAPMNSRSTLAVALAAFWVAGIVVVVWRWASGWKSARAILRESVLQHEGREFQRLRSAGGADVSLVLSKRAIDPGVFGVMRPVLVLPAGISAHLNDAQLEAIMAHELCHVRYRHNMFGLSQKIVEAIFWFHPLVWWVGARLMVERERVCDEAVLGRGGEPRVYAEAILKVCEISVCSPMACVAGIGGSN